MVAIKLPLYTLSHWIDSRTYLLASSSFSKEETEAKEIIWLTQGHTPGSEELRFQLIIIRNCKLKARTIRDFPSMSNSHSKFEQRAGWRLTWEVKVIFCFPSARFPFSFWFLLSWIPCVNPKSPSWRPWPWIVEEKKPGPEPEDLGPYARLWTASNP